MPGGVVVRPGRLERCGGTFEATLGFSISQGKTLKRRRGGQTEYTETKGFEQYGIEKISVLGQAGSTRS